MPLERVVADTNLLISRLLLPQSVASHPVRKAVDEAQLLVSQATLEELADVLSRRKFDPYVTAADRQEFFRVLNRLAEQLIITHPLSAYRDTKIDNFQAAPLNNVADLVISGKKYVFEANTNH